MIYVCTGSRLHFGMLSLAGDNAAAAPVPLRYWGGVGLMVREPGIELLARPAPAWLADGPLAERVLHFATLCAERLPPAGAGPPRPKMHFTVGRCAPEHRGLGTGTQLALAVARALAEGYGLPDRSAAALARLVGRGARSAVGVHGFDRGGFIVEAGKAEEDDLAPEVARVDFPEAWRVVVVTPREGQGRHGPAEARALQQLRAARPEHRLDALCRLVLLGMLPALAEQDAQVFGEAVYDFNRTVGELFKPVQGGVYAHPASEDIVRFVRDLGIPGAGQSSWGPTLFAVTAHSEQARDLTARLRDRFDLRDDEVMITAAVNRGATVTQGH